MNDGRKSQNDGSSMNWPERDTSYHNWFISLLISGMKEKGNGKRWVFIVKRAEHQNFMPINLSRSFLRF